MSPLAAAFCLWYATCTTTFATLQAWENRTAKPGDKFWAPVWWIALTWPFWSLIWRPYVALRSLFRRGS